MVEDTYVRNYRPLFVMDENGLSKYVDQPITYLAPREPTVLGDALQQILQK